MRIGCDLDGVLVDHRNNQSFLLKRWGFEVPKQDLTKDKIKSLLNNEQYKKFTEELYGQMSLGAEEVAGAKQALSELSAHGHEIRIISRRNAGLSFALQWLREHRFFKFLPLGMVHFVKSNSEKEILCKQFNIKLQIDDTPEVLETLKTPAHKILLSRHISRHPAATFTCDNWPDILSYIKTLG